MYRIAFIILCELLVVTAQGQLYEDFSDGNLTHEPRWFGDLDSFIVNENNELQLYSRGEGQASIFTNVSFPDSIIWEFDFMTSFETSASNRLNVILMADTSKPPYMSGYVLEAGSTGSPDPVCLNAIDSGEMQLLACSEGILTPGTFNKLMVRYRADGKWDVAIKAEEDYYESIIRLTDEAPLVHYSVFGLSCNYTTSRNSDFYFDNIRVGEIAPDTIPPLILSVEVSQPNLVLILFNEPLDTSVIGFDVQLAESFMTAVVDVEGRRLNIHLSDSLVSGKYYNVKLNGIRDIEGNTLIDTLISIIYWEAFTPGPGELLITEVLPDPSPPLGIPEVEFVEIFNRTNTAFTTRDLALAIDNSAVTLDALIIPPLHYAVISEKGHWPLLPNAIPIHYPDMPALKNSEGHVTLLHAGTPIHEMHYSDDQYAVVRLDADGRSVEILDVSQPCLIHGNWMASHALSGGTPGLENSVATSLDLNDPISEYYFISEDLHKVQLHFDRLISQIASPLVSISPSTSISSLSIDGEVVTIETSEQLNPDQYYTLVIRDLRDCTGKVIPEQTIEIITPPQHPEPRMVINELLFNPQTGCPTFIEILNYSGQSINADQLALTGSFGTIPLDIQRTMSPDAIIALTLLPETLRLHYPNQDKTAIHQFDFGTIDRNSDKIILHMRTGQVLDTAAYNIEYHHPALTEVKGVSLERISPLINGNDPEAWQSAAEGSGWGTPGTVNSQSYARPDAFDEFILLESEVFSPDGDGFEDRLVIHLSPDVAGKLIQARILDISGQLIQSISEHALAGTDTLIVWDGTDLSGRILREGLYLLHLEVIESDGFSHHYKQPIVLAGRK